MTAAAATLRVRLEPLRPRVGIVLGSSLGALADAVTEPTTISYRDLDGFPLPTVSGHAGELVAGHLGGVAVAVLKGRAHAYETGNAGAMRAPIETLAALGVEILLLTNAAGSLRPEVGPGRLMLLSDHINLAGMNPLIGEPGDERFVPLTDAYDPGLRLAMHRAARSEGIALAEGVYAWFSGPCFETPAEIRMADRMGADAVGMSTAPETILARRFGLNVVAISAITNLGAGIGGAAPSHQETKREGARASTDLVRLVTRFLAELPR